MSKLSKILLVAVVGATIMYWSGSLVGPALKTAAGVSQETLPVFPGAEGFGSTTVAGRGGAVYVVKSLSDGGAGSLRECVEATGPRVCVFEVGGTIDLTDFLRVKNPYLTIAGQTAPYPGVFLRYKDLRVQTHDVLIQHITVGAGDYDDNGVILANNGDADGFGALGSAYNVVFDHVTAWFAIDESVTFYPSGGLAPHDITLSNSISAKSLDDSIQYEGGPHSMGPLSGPGNQRISMIKNIIAHNSGRNPKLAGTQYGEVVNNVIYNWGNSATKLEYGQSGGSGSGSGEYVPAIVAAVGNAYYRGVNSGSKPPISLASIDGSSFYLDDNRLEGAEYIDDWASSLVWSSNQISSQAKASSWNWGSGVSVLPASQVVGWLAAQAGSRPAERQAFDQAIVNDILNAQNGIKSGQIIDCVQPESCAKSAGGWPVFSPTQRGLELPANSNGDDDGDGYTNLEEWLYEMAAEVEGTSLPAPTPAPLPTPAAGSLIKIAGSSTVYYLGEDFKRYVFPNDKVYFSWYEDFSGVITMSDEAMATLPIGGLVTYRPGTKMVTFTTTVDVYAVTHGGVLRKLRDEAMAEELYGVNWNTWIDDVNDAFFGSYGFVADLALGSEYDREAQMAASPTISADKNL